MSAPVPRSDRLRGRTALVTGAASGIGAAIARHFVLAGSEVVLLDLRPVKNLPAPALVLCVKTSKTLRERGRELRLYGPTVPVAEVLRITKLDRVMPVETAPAADWPPELVAELEGERGASVP